MTETLWSKTLGEQIGKLVFRSQGKKFHETRTAPFTNNMAINLEMFGPFMKNGIGRNVKSTLTIAEKDSLLGTCNMEILK